MTFTDGASIRKAIEILKKNDVPPGTRSAHPTCCKRSRVDGTHSPYCYSLKEFYVMAVHPGYVDAKTRRRLKRKNLNARKNK